MGRNRIHKTDLEKCISHNVGSYCINNINECKNRGKCSGYEVLESPIEYSLRKGIKNLRGNDFNSFYLPSPIKDGKIGKSTIYRHVSFTRLNECELCGKVSTPKKIQPRHNIFYWNIYTGFKNRKDFSDFTTGKFKSLLCMSCYNKVKAIMRREWECDEIENLIKNLKKEITKWNKSQTLVN